MTGPADAGSRPIASPCINICQIDAGTRWCIGCGRTIDEIVRWGSTSHADRDAVTAQLPARLAKLSRSGAL